MENGWIERDRKWLDRGRWEYSWRERWKNCYIEGFRKWLDVEKLENSWIGRDWEG